MQCAGMAVAPRVSCCRREEDATLARAVNDNDLLLWGSAHGVPRDVGCVLGSNDTEHNSQEKGTYGYLTNHRKGWLICTLDRVSWSMSNSKSA